MGGDSRGADGGSKRACIGKEAVEGRCQGEMAELKRASGMGHIFVK